MVNPFESLASIRQGVDDYVDAFVSCVAHIYELSDSHCFTLFFNGLQEELLVLIYSKDVVDTFDTIYLACEL